MYAVVLCVDSNYLLPALVTLTSFAAATPQRTRRDLAVCVATTGISSSRALTVADAVKRLGFGRCAIRRAAPPPGALLSHGGYITVATYLRFSVRRTWVVRPHLLYLDADLIVLDDPTPGFEHVEKGRIGVVPDEIVRTIGRDEALPGFVDAYPEHAGAPYYNAGAIWLAATDLEQLTSGSLAQLHHRRRFIYFNDQDALNLWLLDSERATALPGQFNRFELARFRERGDWINTAAGPRRSLHGAKTVHFVGSRKPWIRCCPTTEAVTTYRGYLEDARRLLQQLGDLTLDVTTELASGATDG